MSTDPEPRSVAPYSALGFGCASVMGRVGHRQSLDAMACAYDLGVRHFDIARSYGFGDAEAVLGKFLRGRRDLVTLTSKFGVMPPDLKAWQRLARPALRPVRKLIAPFRQKVQHASGALLSGRRYDVDYARACLETSLRKLNTDYIDFYLLHEPPAGAAEAMDALSAFLDDRVRAGQLRAWGIASSERPLDVPAYRAAKVQQYASSLGHRGAAPGAASTGLRFITRPLRGGDAASHLAPALFAAARLHRVSAETAALHWARYEAGPLGCVIAGMYTRAHIESNVRAMHLADAIDFASFDETALEAVS